MQVIREGNNSSKFLLNTTNKVRLHLFHFQDVIRRGVSLQDSKVRTYKSVESNASENWRALKEGKTEKKLLDF